MASSDLTSLSTLRPTSFNPSNPPPPPPKPSQSTSQTPTSYTPITNGPPLPPPPPPQTLSPQAQQTYAPPSQPNNPPPPDLAEHWLPQILLDKTSLQISQILHDPEILKSLSQSHPSLTPSPLPPHLQQTQALAAHVQEQHSRLLSLRQRAQSHLLHLHALERQWRTKQSLMDRELEPWSAKNLYQRLREGEREGEEWCTGVEGSWLEGPPGGGEEMGEREVGEFLRGYREGRIRVWRRREARERWDEGRVGGWR